LLALTNDELSNFLEEDDALAANFAAAIIVNRFNKEIS